MNVSVGLKSKLEHATKLRVWVDFHSKNVQWSPEKILIYVGKKGIIQLHKIGNIKHHFDLVNEFHFNENLTIEGKPMYLTSFSGQKMNVKRLGERFQIHIVMENIWSSIFLKNTWHRYNRSARCVIGTLAICLATIFNLVYYQGNLTFILLLILFFERSVFIRRYDIASFLNNLKSQKNAFKFK